MTEVLKAISELKDNNSSNAKKEILKNYETNDLKNVLKYTYDPFIQFYLRGDNATLLSLIENKERDDKDLNYQNLVSCLNKLSNREVTGHAAINAIYKVISEVSDEEVELVLGILNKDLRCGVSATTINKVFPKLCKEYDVMLCQSLNVPKTKAIDMNKVRALKYPVRVDIKQDGVRATYHMGMLKTRNGNEIKGYDSILESCKKLCADNPARMLEGELKAKTLIDTMKQLNKIRGKDTSDFVYVLFDKLEHLKDQTNQFQRLEELKTLVNANPIPNILLNEYKECKNSEELVEYFMEQHNKGEEGVVVKIDAPYEFKRSKHWLKLKLFLSEDLSIIRCEEGTGRNENRLGAFVVLYEGKEINVGTGFSDEQRIEYWDNRDMMLGQIIEVSFKQLTPDGSFQFPSFVKLREDLND